MKLLSNRQANPRNLPVHILYIQPYNWAGGPHFSLRSLIANLDSERFKPTVLLPSPGSVVEDFTRMGAEVCFDPGILTIPRSLSPVCQSRFWIAMLKAMGRLENLIHSKNADLVHVNSEACWVGVFAARRAGVPAISHLHGLSVLSPRWVGTLTSTILNTFNRSLIASSGQVRQHYAAAGVRPGLMHLIYNGLDLSAFDPARANPTLRSELGVDRDRPLIGMIANLDYRKGHHDFVKACSVVKRHIPGALFVVVGSTTHGGMEYFHQVRQLVDECSLADSLRFLGPRNDIPDVLASLDVVVQPSLSEAGPLVPLEAMAMERAIVVTDVGGNSEEVLAGKTGLVVPVGDWQAAGDAVVRLLRDPGLAANLGKTGRKHVCATFSDKVYAGKVQELYQTVLNGSR